MEDKIAAFIDPGNQQNSTPVKQHGAQVSETQELRRNWDGWGFGEREKVAVFDQDRLNPPNLWNK